MRGIEREIARGDRGARTVYTLFRKCCFTLVPAEVWRRRAETRRTYVCFVNYVRALLEDFEAQLDVACARCLLQVFEEVLLVDGNGVRVAWPDVGSREPC